MLGLTFSKDEEKTGFGFKFTDIGDPSNVLLDTIN